MNKLKNVWFPSRFQGDGRKRRYFEGYYVKIVDTQNEIALAVIPGVSYDNEGNGHAFIQVLDGCKGRATYHTFAIGEFSSSLPGGVKFSKAGFFIQIGSNTFSDSGVRLELPGLSLEVGFRQNIGWPWHVLSPGAMGPFSFIPGMECRHGVVSLYHKVEGSITLDDSKKKAFSSSTVGYLEKDWGRSFPRCWVWLQTNHFEGETSPCSLMVSAGRVPFAGSSFTGFIAALYWRGRFIPFTTYGLSNMKLSLKDDVAHLVFSRKRQKLSIIAHHAPGVDLVAPQGAGQMIGRVNESLQAWADIEFSENGEVLLRTTTRWMGLEVGGTWPK